MKQVLVLQKECHLIRERHIGRRFVRRALQRRESRNAQRAIDADGNIEVGYSATPPLSLFNINLHWVMCTIAREQMIG